MSRLSAAVIGLGKIGIGYDLTSWADRDVVLTHAKAYLMHKRYDLKFGIDTDKERRDVFSKYTGKPAYNYLKETGMKNIDIVSVCVPTGHHLNVIKEIVKNLRVKYILCEKPIADNESDYREIVAICRRNNIKLVVNYMRRWDPAVFKIKQMLQRKYFGEIRAVHCYYTKGLFNNASHSIDLLHYWFSGEYKIKVINAKKSVTKNDIDASFVMYYKGFEAVFQCGYENDYSMFEIDILTEKGRVRYDDFGEKVGFYKITPDRIFDNYNRIDDSFYEIKDDMGRYQYHVMQGIYNSMCGKTGILSNGVSSGKTLGTCLEVKKLCKNLQ